MKNFFSLAFLLGVFLLLSVSIKPAFADGFIAKQFLPSDSVERQNVVRACGVEIENSTKVEQLNIEFHVVTRVYEHCTSRDGQSYCPTFIHSSKEGGCRAILYTRGNFMSTSFVIGRSPRGSDLFLSIASSSEDERYDYSTAPYRISTPEGLAVVSDTENFVEIDFRPQNLGRPAGGLQLFDNK